MTIYDTQNQSLSSPIHPPSGRGRGTKYILSQSLYETVNDRAGYTRERGLDRETNKELIIKHLRNFKAEGSQLKDILEVLPSLSYSQVRMLLQDLKKEGRASVKGRTKGGRWYPR